VQYCNVCVPCLWRGCLALAPRTLLGSPPGACTGDAIRTGRVIHSHPFVSFPPPPPSHTPSRSPPCVCYSHCRMCGKVVCASCSPHLMPITGLDPATKHRVCQVCFLTMVHPKGGGQLPVGEGR
jgi:hypothetical protein